jgi:hypothetical protein
MYTRSRKDFPVSLYNWLKSLAYILLKIYLSYRYSTMKVENVTRLLCHITPGHLKANIFLEFIKMNCFNS